MQRRVVTFTVALLAALVAAVPVFAIVFGEPDEDAHPYVGLVVFYDEKDVRLHRCSGTLLSPTIFLTAGHCTDKTATARVWFGAEPAVEGFPDFGGVAGTPITHPEFNDAGFPNRRDVGVVVLDPPIPVEVVSVYGALPQLGVLDDLATQRGPEYPTFTVVGYGFQALKPEAQTDVVRYRGSTKLVTLRSFITDGFNIRMSSNPGQASGGICAGDSGGPALLDDSNIVVAINSFILDSHCWGSGYAYRSDIADALDFIGPFLR